MTSLGTVPVPQRLVWLLIYLAVSGQRTDKPNGFIYKPTHEHYPPLPPLCQNDSWRKLSQQIARQIYFVRRMRNKMERKEDVQRECEVAAAAAN